MLIFFVGISRAKIIGFWRRPLVEEDKWLFIHLDQNWENTDDVVVRGHLDKNVKEAREKTRKMR